MEKVKPSLRKVTGVAWGIFVIFTIAWFLLGIWWWAIAGWAFPTGVAFFLTNLVITAVALAFFSVWNGRRIKDDKAAASGISWEQKRVVAEYERTVSQIDRNLKELERQSRVLAAPKATYGRQDAT